MKNIDRITFSLQKNKIERLIICLGYVDERSVHTPQAAAIRVGNLLLQQCNPSPSDVHDPDYTHIRGKDAKGNPRMFYQAETNALIQRNKHGRNSCASRVRLDVNGKVTRSNSRNSLTARAPQLWDSAPVPEFMGVWCDRLLLGDFQRPLRTALYIPHVPTTTTTTTSSSSSSLSPASMLFLNEAIRRVARTLRYLPQSHVLLVHATNKLPFGVIRQCNGSDLGNQQSNFTKSRETVYTSRELYEERLNELIDKKRHAICETNKTNNNIDSNCNTSIDDCLMKNKSRQVHQLSDAMSYFAPEHSCELCSSLFIGVGSETAMRGVFTSTQEKWMNEILVPLATFATALWTANKEQSARYVETFTQDANTFLTSRVNYRLWHTMQAAMLSTRDTNLLNAYFNKSQLDRHLSENHIIYLAETLLRRLQEGDANVR